MPGTRCAVATCKNSLLKDKARGVRNTIYHRFPTDERVKSIWIKRCRRSDKWNSSNSRICSLHFSPDAYKRDLQAELMNYPPKKVLKRDAVPSINIPFMNCICKKHSKESTVAKKTVHKMNRKRNGLSPAPLELNKIITNSTYPIVFKNSLKSWIKDPFTLQKMVEKHGTVSLDFRVVSKTQNNIAWEGDAAYIKATISQFAECLSNDTIHLTSSNPLYHYNHDDYWLYSSYNYINSIFPEDSEISKAVNWGMFGISEDVRSESAFWIGSEGAYTPCHYDSYGFNLVAQLHGRKKWILFPPEDTSALYPTRIPYEESSVFSSVNILNPDLSKHPLFKNSHPHVVILEPGDVLFVPKHWWHFVLSLDASMSINTWIKLDSDTESQIEEAATKALMTSLIHLYEPMEKSWLNPNEELVTPSETLQYIRATLSKAVEENADNLTTNCSAIKIAKRNKKGDVHSDHKCGKQKSKVNFSKVEEIAFEKCFKVQDCSSIMPKTITIENIIDCFVHPDVISLVSKKLKEINHS